jgi:hypothetical protein
MRALLEGRVADARAAIDEALAAGRRARDPNAIPWHGAQLAALLREEARWQELAAFVSELAWLDPHRARIPAARAFYTLFDAEHGRIEQARCGLAELAAGGFEAIARSPDFLIAASFLAELCDRLGDRAAAGPLYRVLSPYAKRVVIVEYALACRGSVSLFLGLLARTLGLPGEARSHFEDAVAANSALGAARYVERARAELAATPREPG